MMLKPDKMDLKLSSPNDDLSMWDRRNDGTCYTWFSFK